VLPTAVLAGCFDGPASPLLLWYLFIIAVNTALMVDIAFLSWPSKTTGGASSDGFRCATPRKVIRWGA
jgi:hypothetical protein